MSYSEVLARFERWYASLPPEERRKPFFYVAGSFLSPEEALAHLRAGDWIGMQLVRMIAAGLGQTSLPPEALRRLVAERVRRSRVVYMVLGRLGPLTPEQLARLIEAGDPRVRSFLEAELAYMAVLERGLLA